MIRFEILLPLFYNDGRPVERENFVQTDDEPVQKFGASSTDSVVVRGHWLYQSTIYHDQLIRVRIDIEDTPENWQAVRDVKEALKTRFQQLDIWITAHRIEIVWLSKTEEVFMHAVPTVQIIAAGLAGIYGTVALVGGCVGYATKGSTASLVAGVISGILLLLCAAGTSFRPNLGLIGAAVIALLLAGRFTAVLVQNSSKLPAWLSEGAGVTAYIMVVGGVLVLVAAGLALLAGSTESSAAT
jgi:uncharacterized membrane protein (UPF0136 family)